MALCLPTLKLFKQKHNPFKTLQPCARSSSSCTSSSFLTSLFSLRLKPLFVFICLYLFLFVFICLYLSLFVFICLYFSLFVFYLSLFVFICLYLSLFVFICLYLFLFVFICLYLSLFVFICLYLFLFVFICLYLSLFVFNLSLFVFICQNLPILSNKPCRSNPCCSGSVQTANESDSSLVTDIVRSGTLRAETLTPNSTLRAAAKIRSKLPAERVDRKL